MSCDVRGDPATPVTAARGSGSRVVARTTRALLVVFVVLTAVATNQLFVLSAHTANWFSWTIEPPVSAAFLGAGYGAGFVLVVSALRVRHWVDARLPVVTVLVFSVLTLVATLAHLDRFHFHAAPTVPRFAAWFWLVIYLVVPVALAAVVVHQQLERGEHPPRDQPLPVRLGVVLAVQGALLFGAGVQLFVASLSGGRAGGLGWWPWALTPLTALMSAGWLIAFGVAAGLAFWERDLQRLRIGALGYAVFGVLQLIAVARFHAELRWGAPATWVYVALLVTVVVTGIVGRAAARTTRI